MSEERISDCRLPSLRVSLLRATVCSWSSSMISAAPLNSPEMRNDNPCRPVVIGATTNVLRNLFNSSGERAWPHVTDHIAPGGMECDEVDVAPPHSAHFHNKPEASKSVGDGSLSSSPSPGVRTCAAASAHLSRVCLTGSIGSLVATTRSSTSSTSPASAVEFRASLQSSRFVSSWEEPLRFLGEDIIHTPVGTGPR